MQNLAFTWLLRGKEATLRPLSDQFILIKSPIYALRCKLLLGYISLAFALVEAFQFSKI